MGQWVSDKGSQWSDMDPIKRISLYKRHREYKEYLSSTKRTNESVFDLIIEMCPLHFCALWWKTEIFAEGFYGDFAVELCIF